HGPGAPLGAEDRLGVADQDADRRPLQRLVLAVGDEAGAVLDHLVGGWVAQGGPGLRQPPGRPAQQDGRRHAHAEGHDESLLGTKGNGSRLTSPGPPPRSSAPRALLLRLFSTLRPGTRDNLPCRPGEGPAWDGPFARPARGTPCTDR